MLAASILSPQFIAGVIIVIVILCIIGSCIRIVPQAHAVIVERLGGYLTTWSVGVHIKMPFVDHVARNVILKEQVVDFDPQPVITKDNVTMRIDTVVVYQITGIHTEAQESGTCHAGFPFKPGKRTDSYRITAADRKKQNRTLILEYV